MFFHDEDDMVGRRQEPNLTPRTEPEPLQWGLGVVLFLAAVGATTIIINALSMF